MESIIFKTLLHSLWQGVVLAVLTALIVLLTTRSAAKVRYNLFVSCLMLFILGVGITFVFEWNKFNPAAAVHTAAVGNTVNLPPGNSVIGTGNTGMLDGWIRYISNYSSLIVLIWLLMISAKSIRFMADINTLFHIRTVNVYAAGAFLENKVKYLAARYGIKQSVRIVQSGRIQVPVVLGHLKPLILVPLGLVNGLSAAEVDAIISHELAHIKRRDYLVNLFQSMVEILFFFNPAVIWLSNMIRTEREYCCDDLAVSATRTKTDYIKALVSCQEFVNEVPAYAMAVSGGGKKHLVNRVQRLISSRNQSLNKIEKAIVGLAMVSAMILTTAFSGNEPVKEPKREVLVMTKMKVDRNAGGDVYVQDGSKTPPVPKAPRAPKVPARVHKASGVPVAPKAPAGAVKVSSVPVAPVVAVVPRAPAAVNVPVDVKVPLVAGAPEVPVTGNDLTGDLFSKGLIKDRRNFSYRLNSDELVIDGVTQSEAIHKKYRKYLKHAGQTISSTTKTD